MKRKIFGIVFCMLLLELAIPSSTANTDAPVMFEDGVEISISAGYRGKESGFGICIDILNHKNENVTVFFNLTLDYLIRNFLDTNSKFNYTVSPDLPVYYHVGLVPCYPDGIKLITFTAEVEGKVFTRNGISIRNFVFLFN